MKHIEGTQESRYMDYYRAHREEVLEKKKASGYMKKYYQEHKDKWPRRTREQQDQYNATRREKYATDEEYRERQKKVVRDYYTEFPLKKKATRLRVYDLSLEDYQNMLLMQGGKCAICGYSDTSVKKFFPVVDHEAGAEHVRGLLCMNCNQGLGKFKHDINFLKSAIEYLGGD